MLRWYNVFFLPGGLLDPQDPSEHKVYILCAKKKKRQQQCFSLCLLLFITDQCQKISSSLVFDMIPRVESFFYVLYLSFPSTATLVHSTLSLYFNVR